MALMKRGQSGRSGQTKCALLEFHFFKSRAQLHVEELQPLLKEKRECFLATKAHKFLRCKPLARSAIWGYDPPWNHEILQNNLVFLKWQFLHFYIIFVVIYKDFIVITDILCTDTPNFLTLDVLLHLLCKRESSPLNLMCTRHNCIQLRATLVWALLYSVLSSQIP